MTAAGSSRSNTVIRVTVLLFLMGFYSPIARPQTGGTEFSGVFAPQEGMVAYPEKPFRDEICLNGRWEFQGMPVPADWIPNKGVAPHLPKPESSGWEMTKIKIPSPWNVNSFVRGDGPDHHHYPSYPAEWERIRMAWMRRWVDIPEGWQNKKIILHFESVAGCTEVYVNNTKVCENFDLFLPFEVDISSVVQPGERAEILVGVSKMDLFNDNSTVGRRIIPGGSMWGSHIAGIWQDVYLWAVPAVNVKNVYIRPLVSGNMLEIEARIENTTNKNMSLNLVASVNEWINKAGKSMLEAPVPSWSLGEPVLNYDRKVKVAANSDSLYKIVFPSVTGLKLWSPEEPNLYGLTLKLFSGKKQVDAKFERFGWREWTINGNKHLLNGREIELHGDSWHFMGIPQMTRRYAWAWFTALKEANCNAVRPHAQAYPRFYLDMADEMGVCILDETAIWASDGGPKFDSELFWKNCDEHLKRLVLRDRNHPSVFGWSISNENKPVILNVMRRPDLMIPQKEAWARWRDICRSLDPTRPWISSDGEEDGEGILPVVVGHYGSKRTLEEWSEYGKPWGVGETGMAYYGSAPQVSKFNGDRSYESFLGRMEGLAFEAYDLIKAQRELGASYTSVFNMAWYALEPLPLGMPDLTKKPDLSSGIIFTRPYEEGMPGVQPERLGSYCTTFNPGYDMNLPLYRPWPLFEAIRDASAPGKPRSSRWAEMPVKAGQEPEKYKKSNNIIFIGPEDSRFKKLCEAEGVIFAPSENINGPAIAIVDGKSAPGPAEIEILKKVLDKKGKILIWDMIPQPGEWIKDLSGIDFVLQPSRSSSVIIRKKDSILSGISNGDLYFTEIQRIPLTEYILAGIPDDRAEVLLETCNTDWSRWNGHSEPIKTASVLRGEREAKVTGPSLVKINSGNGSIFISTLTNLMATDKGEDLFLRFLDNTGVSLGSKKFMTGDGLFSTEGYLKSALLSKPFPAASVQEALQEDFLNGETPAITASDGKWSSAYAESGTFSFPGTGAANKNDVTVTYLSFWLFSPRDLDDLLVEPDIPRVDMVCTMGTGMIMLNGRSVMRHAGRRPQGDNSVIEALPLKRGWNHFLVKVVAGSETIRFSARLKCSDPGFLQQIRSGYENPDSKKIN